MTDAADAIAARLGEVLGMPVRGLERLSGGASRETWALEAGDPPRALIAQLDRSDRATHPDRRPRAREPLLLRAAADAGVPVAAVVADGTGDPVLGSYHVLERVEGTADPARILAGDGVPPPDELLAQLAAALAAVHRMEVNEGVLPVVDDPLALVRGMHDELGQPHPVFEVAFRELERRGRPAPPRRTVVHGDFRMGNVLVEPDGVGAVLDWEIAHVGDPLEDLAWLCVRAWRFSRPDRPAAGLGDRETLVRAYERHAGVAVDRDALRWWELYGTLRWGVICVVQAWVHLGGTARSLEHAVIGRRACEVEWDLLDLLDPGGSALAREELAPEPPALHDRPTAAELLDAAREALGDHVLPLLEGRARFEARVALRALGIVERELRHGPEHRAVHERALRALGVADERELAEAVRGGAFDDRRAELFPALRAIVRCKLEAANPRHLGEGRST